MFLLLERKHDLYCSVGEETGKITSEAEQFGIVRNSQYWFRKLCPMTSPAQAHLFIPELEFVNVERAQESITRNQFRQHMKPKLGPVRQIGLLYRPARLHRLAESIPVFHKRLQIWTQHFRWDCPGNKRSCQRGPKNNSGKEGRPCILSSSWPMACRYLINTTILKKGKRFYRGLQITVSKISVRLFFNHIFKLKKA